MNKTNIEAIQLYFQDCPLLAGNKLNIDGLSDIDLEYAIHVVPANPIVKPYVDGSSLRQTVFILTSKNSYDRDISLTIQTSGFYEKLSKWIEEQNKSKSLPILDERKVAQSIEAQTDGYLFNTDQTMARYQIQFRMLYLYQI